jgi:hypothetical protein
MIGRRWIVEDNVDTSLFGTVMLGSFSLVCVVWFHCSLSIVFRCLLPPSLLGYRRPFTSEVPCMCDRSKRTSPLVSILLRSANPWSDEALVRKGSPWPSGSREPTSTGKITLSPHHPQTRPPTTINHSILPS